ncbi:MAG TPA: hypothetical protein PLQ36_02440 [Candidatus Gracilibacteria bacterium]|nr:hypothetical protein [Candidatus Gracilibacteria bacterium]
MLGHLPLKYYYLAWVLILISILYTGYLIGRLSVQLSPASPICAIETDFKPDSISTLSLQEINPQFLKGEVEGGSLRIVTENEVLEIPPAAEFKLNVSSVFKDMISALPDDTQFFASKRGKNYYPIREEKILKNLSPENLIFFKTAEEAEKAGFRR